MYSSIFLISAFCERKAVKMDNFLAERNIWVVEEEVAFIFPKIRLFTFR